MKHFVLPLVVALGSWVAPTLAGTESPEAGRVFLSWHAPYDMPGASSNLTLAAGDTTREDTLYLTCDPGVEAPGLTATTSVLTIRTALGDTLGPYWQFGRGGSSNVRNVRVTFARDSAIALPVPWKRGAPGAGGVGYDYSSERGTLGVVGAVATAAADSMRPGTRYVLARVLFRHPAADVAGAGRPVCVEWSQAKLHLRGERDLTIEHGDRFASWNSPACEVCKRYRVASALKAWSPKSRP